MNEMLSRENSILIAYWTKAMSPPTSRLPASTLWLPIHMRPIIVKLMVNMMRGIIDAMIRLTLRWVSTKSLLAASNRSASCSSRLKARTTRIPVRFSRRTRLSLSILAWMALKRGIPLRIPQVIKRARKGRAHISVRDRSGSMDTAIMTPPTAMMGALTTILRVIRTTIWTWVMSLVVRVMSDAVPSLSNSRREKRSTREKTFSRRSRPKPVEVLEDRYPAPMAQAIPMKATRSIRPPVSRIYRVSPAGIPTSTIFAMSVGSDSSERD